MNESEGSQYPIGSTMLVNMPLQHDPVEAYVVLYKLPEELHEKYKDQFVIPGFIKALAMRSQTELNEDGSVRNFSPKDRAQIEDTRNNPFELTYTTSKIDAPLSYGTYELEASLRIHYKKLEISADEAERHRNLIYDAITENWGGNKVGRMNFSIVLNTQLQCDDCENLDQRFRFGSQFIEVTISPTIKRSYVMMYEKTGNWETQQYRSPENYKKMIAHEFGHIIGFRDLYADVAYYDLLGNLISKKDYVSLSIFSPLGSLSQFPHLGYLSRPISEHNKNIMASTLGHVSKKHLEAIVNAYNRNCAPFPGEQPWSPFLQHRR